MAKPSKREVELERGIVGMAGYLRWGVANGLSAEPESGRTNLTAEGHDR